MSNIKAIRCIIDVSSVPLAAYKLPSDGRQHTHLCMKRRMVALQLAAAANPDGTSISTSVQTIEEKTGIDYRTIHRILRDLETLGFLENRGWHKFFGAKGPTRVRALNISKMLGRPPVPSSDGAVPVPVPSSNQPVPSSGLPVPSSDAASRVEDGTQPSCIDRSPTAPSNQTKSGGLEEFMKHLPAAMVGATDTKRHRAEIEAQLAQYGRDILLAALAYWIKNRNQEIETLRCKWNFWFQECAQALTAAPAYAKWLSEEAYLKTPAGKAAIEASIAVQKKAMVAFMDKEPPPQNGVDVSDLFPEAIIAKKP